MRHVLEKLHYAALSLVATIPFKYYYKVGVHQLVAIDEGPKDIGNAVNASHIYTTRQSSTVNSYYSVSKGL